MSRYDIVPRQDEESRLGHPGAPPRAAEHRLPPLPEKSLLHVLWRGRWIILLCVALGVGGGFFYLSRQTPVYSSSSRILVEPERNPISNREGAGPPLNRETYCELIKSPLILELVQQDFPELRQMKTFAGLDSPIGLLRANLTAEVNKSDDLITVSFQSPYPAEAASIVNAVVRAYKDYNAQRNLSQTAQALKTLEDWKRKWEAQLTHANSTLQSHRTTQPATTRPGETAPLPDIQAEALQQRWLEAFFAAADADIAYRAAEATAADPTRRDEWIRRWVKGDAEARAIEAEIHDLQRYLAAQKGTMGDRHGSVKLRQAQEDELRLKLAELANNAFAAHLAAAEENLKAAQRREAEVKALLQEQQARVLASSGTAAGLGLAEAEVRRLEKLTDALDEKIKDLQLTGSIQPMAISVLERAEPGVSPVKPRPTIVIFEALMIGLVAGCGLAYLRDWTDHRLASVDEIQARLGLNVLGVLPRMPGRETPAVRGQKVQLDPMSDEAEAYRTIRTAVYFGAPHGKTKRILVTSPVPGDGKTTSASNLAIAMAQAGQRVLLMDCDFRKPMQHRIFGVEDGLGLSNVLSGQAPLSKAVKPTATQGLYLLPSGPVPRNPSEILNSENFAKLMSALESKFDHIVIDSPPVVPVTDARILGASCDVTILVLRAQKSTRRVSEHACESLLSVGARILGVIVNDVPRRRGGYGYASYGGYRYGYDGKNGNGDAVHVESNGNGAHAPAGRTNGARLPSTSPADGGNGAA